MAKRTGRLPSVVVACAAAPALVLALAAAPAWADGSPSEADRLFQQGRKAATAGDYGGACRAFADSLKLDRATGTLMNLGDCEEQQGHLAAALRYFRASLDKLPPSDSRVANVQERVRSLDERVPHVVLRPAAGFPADATVSLDGVPVDRADLGRRLDVETGRHEILVAAPGRRDARHTFTATSGSSLDQELAAGPAGAAGDAPEPEGGASADATTEPTHPLRTAGFVVGGVGIASLWVGSVTGLLALDRKHTQSVNCDAGNACNQAGYDAARSGKTLALASTITLLAGAAATGLGIFFVVHRGDGGGSSAPAPTTAVAPHPLPGGAALTVLRSF